LPSIEQLLQRKRDRWAANKAKGRYGTAKIEVERLKRRFREDSMPSNILQIIRLLSYAGYDALAEDLQAFYGLDQIPS